MSASQPRLRLESPHTPISDSVSLAGRGGGGHQHGFNMSPGDSEVQPGLRTLAPVDLVGCPTAPCIRAVQMGSVERS